MPNNLEQKILNNWPTFLKPLEHYTIALSGGIDSVALTYALSKIRQNSPFPFKLDAVHINHGISPNSNHWEQFCQNFCNQLNIPLKIFNYQIIKNGGESLENIARNYRYQSFHELESQVIVLAHHLDDQIETTLSQIMRGSNLHNVAGMRAVTHKRNKFFWRPFLTITRSEIERYCSTFDLDYIEDESNLDSKYLRNFLRNEIIPRLKAWDPSITTKILNFNQELQNTLDIIDDIAKEDCNLESYSINNSKFIEVKKFVQLSHNRQVNALCYFIKYNNLQLPSHKQLLEFVRQVNECNIDRKPKLGLNKNYNLIKNNSRIYIDQV